MNRPLRILHCPTMTGGNPQQLARAERAIGLDSWSVALHGATANYDVDENRTVENVGPLRMELARWPLLWKALRRFDIIHFNFGASIMPYWNSADSPVLSRYPIWLRQLYGVYARCLEQRDLPLLKKAGKGIIVTYQGDDARQGDFCLQNFPITVARSVEPGYYSADSDKRKRKRIQRFARYADRLFALNPDLLHVLPPQTRFLPYAAVDLNDWQPAEHRQTTSDVPIVLHAPTHRGAKGTELVIEAIDRLHEEGIAVELALVEGRTRAEARAMYERADILVDQLLAGWYGGLAVELMALGKPVMCYLRDTDLRFIPEAMREELPIINVTPTILYETLKQWLTVRRNELAELGLRSRKFVECWHDPLKIARQLKTEYETILRR